MKHAYQTSINPGTAESEKASEFLHTVHDILRTQIDLSPENDSVNVNLSALVSRISEWTDYNQLTLADFSQDTNQLLKTLPPLCAKAECQMEKWWANKIIRNEASLESFWYLKNYQFLMQQELELLQHLRPEHIVFLGGGALPLTAILMAYSNPDLKVTCIDKDSHACRLAEALVKKLGLTPRIKIIETDAESYNYSPKDLVICASLLETNNLYRNLYNNNVLDIIVRDSEGLYRFIYQSAQQPSSTKYMEIGRTELNSECINISRHFEKVIS